MWLLKISYFLNYSKRLGIYLKYNLKTEYFTELPYNNCKQHENKGKDLKQQTIKTIIIHERH